MGHSHPGLLGLHSRRGKYKCYSLRLRFGSRGRAHTDRRQIGARWRSAVSGPIGFDFQAMCMSESSANASTNGAEAFQGSRAVVCKGHSVEMISCNDTETVRFKIGEGDTTVSPIPLSEETHYGYNTSYFPQRLRLVGTRFRWNRGERNWRRFQFIKSFVPHKPHYSRHWYCFFRCQICSVFSHSSSLFSGDVVVYFPIRSFNFGQVRKNAVRRCFFPQLSPGKGLSGEDVRTRSPSLHPSRKKVESCHDF